MDVRDDVVGHVSKGNGGAAILLHSALIEVIDEKRSAERRAAVTDHSPALNGSVGGEVDRASDDVLANVEGPLDKLAESSADFLGAGYEVDADVFQVVIRDQRPLDEM